MQARGAGSDRQLEQHSSAFQLHLTDCLQPPPFSGNFDETLSPLVRIYCVTTFSTLNRTHAHLQYTSSF